MILGQLLNNDFYFNACLKLTQGDKVLVDTRETGWGDIPFDLLNKAVTEISVDCEAITIDLEE